MIRHAAYAAHPIPTIAHIVAGALTTQLGAFLLLARLRGQTCHRWSVRVFVLAILVASLTRFWMCEPFLAYGGSAKCATIAIFGVAMMVSILIGLWRIRRRHMLRHRAWMIRSYAIGLGPAKGRQVVDADQLSSHAWAVAP